MFTRLNYFIDRLIMRRLQRRYIGLRFTDDQTVRRAHQAMYEFSRFADRSGFLRDNRPGPHAGRAAERKVRTIIHRFQKEDRQLEYAFPFTQSPLAERN